MGRRSPGENGYAPECPDEGRPRGVAVWHQAADASRRWNHPAVGGDFLLEHRLRLFLDYGRLVCAPYRVGGLRFDSLAACGCLENVGGEGPPPDGGEDDPFAGFPRPTSPSR